MASSDAYMELQDPEVWGETHDDQFGMEGRALGAFEISKFDIDISAAEDDNQKKRANSQSGSGGQNNSGGGGGGNNSSGRKAAKHEEATLDTFTITKHIDKASPDLFLACCKKTKIEWGIISIRESGEFADDKYKRKPYLVLEFRNLSVKSFKWGIDPGDAEGAASMETIEFDFETVLIKYSRQDLSGQHRVVKIKGWNRQKNNDEVEELDTRLGQGSNDSGGSSLH